MTTHYSLVSLYPSGEKFALRFEEETVTGWCGALAEDELDAPGDHYHYDDELNDLGNEADEALAQWNGEYPDGSPYHGDVLDWVHIRNLPAEED